MGLFLTKHELEALTGYKTASKQSKWLEAHGYILELNALGIPRITYSQIEEARRVPHSIMVPIQQATSEPDFSGLRAKISGH